MPGNYGERPQSLSARAERRRTAALMRRRQGHLGAEAAARAAAGFPICSCIRTADLFGHGIGWLSLGRRMNDGRIALGAFLVDVFCLGVKDAFFRQVSAAELDAQIGGGDFVPIAPDYALKLLQDAVGYAGSFGLPPHPEYGAAVALFGDVSAETCQENFTFGKDGKPFYVSGPNDTPARIRQIVNALNRTCGPGGFEYAIVAG